MRKSLFLLLLAVMAGRVDGQSQKEPKPVTLFTVDGNPVYTEEFIRLFRKNHLKREEYTEKSVDEYLDLYINFKLKVTEAHTRGYDTAEVFRRELRSYNEELKRPYLSEKSEIDRLTQEAYQRLQEEVRASHILIGIPPSASPEDTLKAYRKIAGLRQRAVGGENFEKLVKEFSEEPSAKTTGGDLGYFTVLQMVFPFEQAAYSLKVGEISQPVRTRFGYHVIKLTGRRPAQGEVEVSHIILRTSSPDDPKMKNKILDIYDQLQAGRNWDELCKEYSDDAATKDTGGKLRPFGVGALAGVPEFEKMAFSLKTPGEISDPFQSAYGWHLIRLERRLPVPPYKDVEASLKRRVSRDERVQIAEKKALEMKKMQYGFSENKQMKEKVLGTADSTLRAGKWRFRGENSLKGNTLITIQGEYHLAGEFIRYVEMNQDPNSLSPTDYMNQLYDRYVGEKLGDTEDRKLQADHPEYRNLMAEYKEGILLFTIMEKEVWNKASEDTVNLRKYYEANKANYNAGERVRARIFTTDDKAFFTEALRKINDGDTLKQEFAKGFKAILPARNYQRGENKAIDKISWTTGLQTTQVNETYYIVEIEKLILPGARSLEEAHAQVVADYQGELEKVWVAALKAKTPVKINNKGKKFVVKELLKK